MEIPVEEILEARERRWHDRHNLVEGYGIPVVAITLNIPGAHKREAQYRFIHREALRAFVSILRGYTHQPLEHLLERMGADGPEALLAVAVEGRMLKEWALRVEENHSLGRLMDIDVLSENGSVVSRRTLGREERQCLVCGGIARNCIVSGAHSPASVMEKIGEIIADYRIGANRMMPEKSTGAIASLALRAMLYEACAAPKPGLVDPSSRGAHRDMDIFTFVDSSLTILPFLEGCAVQGIEGCGGSLRSIFQGIRETGVRGERAMFSATGGVNTQKGLLFSLGVLCAATGWVIATGQTVSPDSITDAVKEMTGGLVEEELIARIERMQRLSITMNSLSAGERVFLEYGVSGIRGEAERGFPTVVNFGLPFFRDRLRNGSSLNDALIDTLLQILTVAEDSNVLWRAGMDGLNYARAAALKALETGGMRTAEGSKMIVEMDGDFTMRNISPGGSADLLAVTVYLHFMPETIATIQDTT